MQAEIIQSQKQYEHHLKEQIKHLDEIVVTQNQIKKFKHDFLNYEINIINVFDNSNDIKMSEEYLIELINQKLASLILYYELQK